MSTTSSSQPPKKRRRTSFAPAVQLETLPLMLPKKSSENTILVQLDDQELDMKGDAGTIGRLRVKEGRIELDLNGKKLHGQIYPSVTCMVVSINKSEARVTQMVDEICVVSRQEDMVKQMSGTTVGGEIFVDDESDVKRKKKQSSITKTFKTATYSSKKEPPSSATKKAPAVSGVIDLS